MILSKSKRNQIIHPNTNEELMLLRSGKWKTYQEADTQSLTLNGETIHFRTGLTFTPYANPSKCNAHCRFCSEELRRKHQKHLTAERLIGNHEEYFKGLGKALRFLVPLQEMGLSLSGLEATSDPFWLLQLLALFSESGMPKFNEKILYTNGSGLYNHPDLVEALSQADFDRIELSRCHYDDAINQQIMYINRNEAVHQNQAYEQLVKRLQDKVFVKNSCILTRTGINSIEELEQYLDWAISLGVQCVVFRELSQLDETYEDNRTKKWVEDNRISIDPIISAVAKSLEQQRKNWVYLHSTAGYYYYNEHYKYKGMVEVILETSSYTALIASNTSALFQKLVFHSNGNLCGDWDPDNKVIAKFF